MATPVITPQQVRDVSLTGEFDALTDAQIQPKIDTATLWYGAPYLEALTGTPGAIKYTTAHLLHCQLAMEKGGVAGLVGASSRALAGVGARGFPLGAWGPAEFAEWMKLPSAYMVTLSGIRAGLPPGMTTTGAGA